MTEKKMTKRDMFAALVAYMNGEDTEITEEGFVAFAEKEIAALDARAVSAKARAKKNVAANDELAQAVLSVLTNEPKTIADIAVAVGEIYDGDVTISKVQYRANQFAKNEQAIKTDITVGDGETKRRLVAYTLA